MKTLLFILTTGYLMALPAFADIESEGTSSLTIDRNVAYIQIHGEAARDLYLNLDVFEIPGHVIGAAFKRGANVGCSQLPVDGSIDNLSYHCTITLEKKSADSDLLTGRVPPRL